MALFSIGLIGSMTITPKRDWSSGSISVSLLAQDYAERLFLEEVLPGILFFESNSKHHMMMHPYVAASCEVYRITGCAGMGVYRKKQLQQAQNIVLLSFHSAGCGITRIAIY